MHLGDGVITPMCAVYGAAAATAGVGIAAWLVRSLPAPPARRLVLATALVFAMQGLNLPAGAGVSGHLLGGVLLAHWFGGAWATIAMTSVLIVQSLLLADGGLAALGLNVTTMAIVPCLAVYPLISRWIRNPWARLAIASWLSVMAAAACCVAALASRPEARGVIGGLASHMLAVHAVIGVLEAALALLIAAGARSLQRPWQGCVAGAALLVLAWMGQSPWPDGLELSLARFGLDRIVEAPWFALSVENALVAMVVGVLVVSTALAALISLRQMGARHD